MIEDYALIGSRGSAALVSKTGSIDWLCLPRFDSPACFTALLGSTKHGRWLITPTGQQPSVERQYRHGSTVLETTFAVGGGTVVLTDAMQRRDEHHDVLRHLKCTAGKVRIKFELILRSDFGLIVPRLKKLSGGCCQAITGPDKFLINSQVELELTDSAEICAQFSIEAGQELAFSLTWSPSYHENPPAPDVTNGIERETKRWQDWAKQFKPKGDYAEAELRSIVTLQALTDEQTGGFIAAATTSLPEQIGGDKNWDYRFCWLRDGAFSLRGLIDAGFTEDAKSWHKWLLRAVANSPDKMQIMYNIQGKRNLQERKLHWLPGYKDSRPVRDGNEASSQFQLDIFGQVLDIFYQARDAGVRIAEESWPLERALVEEVLKRWRNPDAGIWELRKQVQQFTESKVMAWVAVDRGIKSIERFGCDGPVEKWREARSEMHDAICRAGFNTKLNSFVQYFGGDSLDAALLLLPLFDFLPADDPRILGTVQAIEKNLLRDGLVVRYHNYGNAAKPKVQEGTFLACSFWLVDNYVRQGRKEEARELFERLLYLRNDVGLMSEEYDTQNGHMIGNYPQALTHAALIRSVHTLNEASS